MGNMDSIPANDSFLRRVSVEEIPLLLGEVERVRAILWARLVREGRSVSAPQAPAVQVAAPETGPDRLLTVAEAGNLLGLSRSTLGWRPAIREALLAVFVPMPSSPGGRARRQ